MPNLYKTNFKVGDIITVRSWDDMAKEFGVFEELIVTPIAFIPAMEKLCGKKARIHTVNNMYEYTFQECTLDFDIFKEDSFYFCVEMFEEAIIIPNYDLRDKFAEGGFDAEFI